MKNKMSESDRNKLIKNIAEHYDIKLKKLKLAEECSELIQAIIKDNLGEPNNFAEEFSDVKLMILQIEVLMGKRFNTFVDSMIDHKIERQLERMKKEEQNEEKENIDI